MRVAMCVLAIAMASMALVGCSGGDEALVFEDVELEGVVIPLPAGSWEKEKKGDNITVSRRNFGVVAVKVIGAQFEHQKMLRDVVEKLSSESETPRGIKDVKTYTNSAGTEITTGKMFGDAGMPAEIWMALVNAPESNKMVMIHLTVSSKVTEKKKEELVALLDRVKADK